MGKGFIKLVTNFRPIVLVNCFVKILKNRVFLLSLSILMLIKNKQSSFKDVSSVV